MMLFCFWEKYSICGHRLRYVMCITKTFTLDPKKVLCDLHFMMTVYYCEHKSLEQIADILGCKKDCVSKRLDTAFKEMKANSRNNIGFKGWQDGHFNQQNTDKNASWRNDRYKLVGREFQLKVSKRKKKP
jgi:hypothetical protein